MGTFGSTLYIVLVHDCHLRAHCETFVAEKEVAAAEERMTSAAAEERMTSTAAEERMTYLTVFEFSFP